MFYDVNRYHAVVLCVWLFILFFMTQLLFPVFTNFVPEWKCASNLFRYGWICGSDAYYRSLFSQVQFVGVLLGTFSFGMLSDAFGRKPISTLTMGLGITMNFITAFSPTWQILLVIRFILGLTIGGGSVVVITFAMEMLLPKQRMVLRAIFNWGIARIMLTSICWLYSEWRSASIVTAITALPALLIVVFVFPESPTWLHNKGKLEEMVESEKYIARFAGVKYEPVQHAKINHTKSFCELIQTKGLFKRLTILWTMWFTACLCSYATDFNSSNLSGNLYVNQVLYGILIAISKLVLLTVDTTFPKSFTRRRLHQGSQIVVIGCFLILTALTLTHYQGILFLVMNLFGTVFIEYTWDACYLCAIESMETSCRSSATGSCSLVARFGALIAPVLNYLNTQWPPAVYFTVVAMGTINFLVSYFFLVETKTVNLDEVKISEEEGTPMLEKNETKAIQ